jgi:2-C-methyl-D-erythritol 4-phosphate cytidylyltransferase
LARVPAIERVFLILAPGDTHWKRCDASGVGPKLTVLYCGGASRPLTVKNGLEAVAKVAAADDWILVHDAARPCVTEAQIDALIKCGDDDPNFVGGLLAVPVADTLKRACAPDVVKPAGWWVSDTIPRDGLWQAQTPQMFRLGVLREALERVPNVTDEASAIEAIGLHPKLVESDAMNLKVTYPCDRTLAEMILRFRLTA